jgi:hypothetical protein
MIQMHIPSPFLSSSSPPSSSHPPLLHLPPSTTKTMSNSLISLPTRRATLYTTAGLSLLALYKHTTVSISSIFRAFDSTVHAGALSPENVLSAKINFLTTSAGMLTFGRLYTAGIASQPYLRVYQD